MTDQLSRHHKLVLELIQEVKEELQNEGNPETV